MNGIPAWDRDGYEPVARVADVPDGVLHSAELRNGDKVCLINRQGEIHAVSDTCTHQDFSMCDGTLLPGNVIECVWHGTRFDFTTGAVLAPPADRPLPVYHVRVQDGDILVGPVKQ